MIGLSIRLSGPEQVCNLLRDVLFYQSKCFGRGCKPRPAKMIGLVSGVFLVPTRWRERKTPHTPIR
jgi:hypothetical protein